jgi:hypothetical protein
MGKVPSAVRSDSNQYDDDDENSRESEDSESPKSNSGGRRKKERPNFLLKARDTLSGHLVGQADMNPLGRLPRTEEEKRTVFRQLALLKSARQTHEECALRLGASRSTIAEWLNDPLYREIQQDLTQSARSSGFVSAGELVQDAIATIYHLMQHDPSGFVRYKSAEYLLKIAGMELPPSETQADDSREIAHLLETIRLRSGERQASGPAHQINVDIHVSGADSPIAETRVVDADPGDMTGFLSPAERAQLLAHQRAMQEEYERPMLPGGKIPDQPTPEQECE